MIEKLLSHRIEAGKQISFKIKLIWGIWGLMLLTICTGAHAQPLTVVSDRASYKKLIRIQREKAMVVLDPALFTYDLRYKSPRNFTGKILYASDAVPMMRIGPAAALSAAALKLADSGLGFKIFDAYRPYAVTQKMWDLIHDTRYVADPAKGSGHNRGLSVDLTLINLSDSSEVDMGTGFDNFTDSAHQNFKDLPATVLQNRLRLRRIMESIGFVALETEWWHYSWPNTKNYEVLDLPFSFLKRKGH